MNGLYIIYLIVGIAVGLTTIVLGARSVLKKTAKELSASISPLTDASEKIQAAFGDKGHGDGLGIDIDNYAAVEAANRALRSVISDSTRQLAESAAELARSREITSQLRAELSSAVREKTQMQERVAFLESEVRELRAKLEYFTNPPRFSVERDEPRHP